MTIPSIVGKYQRKTLESQFKKTISVVSQVILKSKSEMGIENFSQYCTNYDEANNLYTNTKECYNVLYRNLLAKNINSKYENWSAGWSYDISREPESIKTYNGKQTLTASALAVSGYGIFSTFSMPDGSFINFYICERNLMIPVDTNGFKAPNKFGHDIFILYVNPKNDAVYFYVKPNNNLTDEDIQNGIDDGTYKEDWQAQRAWYPCSITSNQKANGIGCIYYALIDKCPYDSSKRYFECLP